MDGLFLRRKERYFPAWLYDMVADMFAIVQHWQPHARGAARGRLFETIFHRYCDQRGLHVTERPGARTVRHTRSASGFAHETDAVVASPDLTVHFELKHLSVPLGKNEILIFNQKGLDFLFGTDEELWHAPFYRVVLSGEILTPEARRFALQWGIIIIEPDRLPLLMVHGLSGRLVPRLRCVNPTVQDEIWTEVPALLPSLQRKVKEMSRHLDAGHRAMMRFRQEWALDVVQRVVGDQYWMALDSDEPQWLERRYEELSATLGLELASMASAVPVP